MPKSEGKYSIGSVVVAAIGFYILASLASGPTGFVAMMENITSTNPLTTLALGLVLALFFLGLALHYLPTSITHI